MQAIRNFKLPEKQFWAEYSYRSGKLLVETGFWFGAYPIVFPLNDQERKQKIVTSKFHRLRWMFCLGSALLAVVLIEAAYLRDLRNGKIIFLEDVSMFRSFVALGLFTTGLIHLHTIWKMEAIVEFINRCVAYYEQFQEKYATASIHDFLFEDLLCAALKACFFIGTVCFLPIAAVMVYLIKCEFHVMAFVIPMCEADASIWLMPIMMFAQAYIAVVMGLSMIFYIDVMLALIVFGNYTVKESLASEETAKTIPLLRTETHFCHNYRCFQLISGYVNDCIGQVLMPGQFLFVMTLTVFLIAHLIRIRGVPIIMYVGAILFLVLIALYFVSFIGKGSELLELSNTLVLQKKEACRSKYMRAFMKSCSPVKAIVGPFMILERSLVLGIFATIIDNTVTVLLI